MLPMSVAIITHNEADRLGKTLTAIASISRDIVVVDSGSTDNTVAIAESFGARVIRRKFTSYNEQRNYALSQCVEPWVLYLNAGDVVSVELRIRLQWIVSGVANVKSDVDIASSNPANVDASHVAYKIRCQSLWFGGIAKLGSLRRRHELRFFTRGAVEFGVGNTTVNTTGNTTGKGNGFDDAPALVSPSTTVVHPLNKPIIRHVATTTLDAHIGRMNRHSDVLAAYHYRCGRYRPVLRGMCSGGGFAPVLRYPLLSLGQVGMGLRFAGRFIFEFILRGTFLNRHGGLSQALSASLVPEVARLKVRRLYADYASMYDVPAFEVSDDTPDDREYGDDGRLVIRRILVSRTDKLGDMIVCVPAIRMLRLMFPDARLDVLASPYNSDIPQNLPYVDCVYTRGSLGAELPGKKSVDDKALAATLNSNKYDVIIMTMTSPDVTKFASTLIAPYKVSGKHLNVYRHGVRIRRLEQFRHQHESEYALQLVRHTDPKRYDAVFDLDRAIYYSADDKRAIETFLSERNLAPCYCKPNLFQPQHGEGFVAHRESVANIVGGASGDAGSLGGSGSIASKIISGIAGVLGISEIPSALATPNTLSGSAGGAVVGGAVVGDAITRRERYTAAVGVGSADGVVGDGVGDADGSGGVSIVGDVAGGVAGGASGGVVGGITGDVVGGGDSDADVHSGVAMGAMGAGNDCFGCDAIAGGYIVINIYHAGSSNNASLLTYRKIIAELTKRGYEVVIIAVPYKPRVYNALIAERYFGDMQGVHIFTDATNILRTAAIIHAATLYIGSSTGPTHMANALDTPSVIVFRNNPLEMRVWSSKYTHNYHVLIPNKVRATPYIKHVNHLTATVVSHSERCLKELY